MKKATFGAGCFWGVEEAFRKINGVEKTTVGYMGGTLQNPTYEDVCTDTTGHVEVVQIEYNSKKISYEDLLNIFWNIHDPTQLNRQGPDVGTQYKSVIFYHNKHQKRLAEDSKKKLMSIKPIVTEILKAKKFYKAEEYHQQYLQKNSLNHCRM